MILEYLPQEVYLTSKIVAKNKSLGRFIAVNCKISNYLETVIPDSRIIYKT